MESPKLPAVQPAIPAASFHPSRYAPGGKHSLVLVLGAEAPEIALPVLLVRGSAAGKTLVVTAGVHGDEFEGVRAILDLYADLDPIGLAGTMIAVPVANPPAFWNGSRTNPIDNANLARTFPGDRHGSSSQIIAFHLGQSIIAHADFYLDLHSAGVKLLMPSMVGYDANDPRSYDAALAFGAPVMWGHPTMKPGRTLSFAGSRGIPWLYTEARGAGRIDPEDLHIFKSGILNLMRHLRMLAGPATPRPVRHRLFGDGDIDSSISAKQPGFLVPSVELLEHVNAGKELGHTVDLHGRLVESFQSPRDGVVALIHVFPMLKPGESVFLITELAK